MLKFYQFDTVRQLVVVILFDDRRRLCLGGKDVVVLLETDNYAPEQLIVSDAGYRFE